MSIRLIKKTIEKKIQLDMFKKYCPEKITKQSYYDIDVDYKLLETNKNINFLEKSDFFDYFNHKFGKFLYKNNKNWNLKI